MLLLNVPYEEKDEAKSLGAKWNPELKKWYIQNTEDCGKFMKWIWKDYKDYEELYILKDHLYIAEGIRICNKCKKATRVIGLGIDKYYQVYDENEDYNFSAHLCEDDDIEISPITEDLPKQILDYCMNNWNLKKHFLKQLEAVIWLTVAITVILYKEIIFYFQKLILHLSFLMLIKQKI